MNECRTANGQFAEKHGQKGTRLYRVWCAMKERCNNPHNKRFPHYGAKGIKVCTEWAVSFETFRNWALQNGYTEGLTIDRIDCEGNYEPMNCRWVTTAQQNRNYSRNHYLTHNGQTLCITDWAKLLGIKAVTISHRLNAGKSTEEALRKEDGRSLRWKTIS